MATVVDPETYLRLACERHLLAGDRQRGPREAAELAVIGRALIASGQLEEDRVRGVLDECLFALGLREENGRWRFHLMGREGAERQRLSAQRVVVGDFRFGDPEAPMTLERLVFADDTTHFELSGVGPSQGPPTMHFRRHASSRGRLGPSNPLYGQPLTVRDERGTTATASPSGGGSSGRSWEARFSTDAPLWAATAWIDIDGARVVLPEPPLPAEVRIEAVEDLDPLTAMLYGEILAGGGIYGGEGAVETAVEALVATGALKRDDQVVGEVERIARAFTIGRPAPNLPPPWNALRRAAKSDGPVGRLPIGAVVESLEGTSIRFDALTSEEDSFSVALAVSPGWPLLLHFSDVRLECSPVHFWAEDDRRNAYVLSSGGGGGSPGLAEGTIDSMAPLDPRAKELRLLPTGRLERAVVTISLAGLEAGP